MHARPLRRSHILKGKKQQGTTTTKPAGVETKQTIISFYIEAGVEKTIVGRRRSNWSNVYSVLLWELRAALFIFVRFAIPFLLTRTMFAGYRERDPYG